VTRTLLTCSLFVGTAAWAQQPLVLLDPARGGSDGGAHIGDRVQEKQVTLDLAQHLASLLRARGFTVEMTRDTDVDTSNDARAALANTTHPIACILLHASLVGRGVHLYTTSLRQAAVASGSAVRWDEAQAAYADRSHALREDLKAAFPRSKIPVSTGQTWMRPLDNMQCPAVAVEVSPQDEDTTAEDNGYQAQISSAVANTLLLWRNKVASLAPPEPPPPVVAPKPVVKPAEAPKPVEGGVTP
jgi:N-acetylmuramoyl-L-alanine amidase